MSSPSPQDSPYLSPPSPSPPQDYLHPPAPSPYSPYPSPPSPPPPPPQPEPPSISPAPTPVESLPHSLPPPPVSPAPTSVESPKSVLPSPSPPSPPPPSPPQSSRPPRPTRSGLIAGTVIGSVVILGICVIFLIFVWRKRRGTRTSGLENPSPEPLQPRDEEVLPSAPIALRSTPRTFIYEELALATNGFSESNFLGQGGFGTVHKGVLPNKQTVAIKQLKSGSKQGKREFLTEVEVISGVHHRHLVSLVGYCIAEAQRTMMLVYEFVPNKTLEFHLHGKGSATIDWTTRMKIAVGSAKGLAYLHEECQPKIIHRDIKAANILLDKIFDPKVADFGIARFSLDTETHVSTRIMGTFGYLAPEYAGSGKLTDKSDVFSFGVVLLELITGRKAVDVTAYIVEGSMVEWARPLLAEALKNENFEVIADPRLRSNYNFEEMFRMVCCAASCVSHSAGHRPRMSQVVQALLRNVSVGDHVSEESTPMSQNSDELNKWRKVALEGLGYSVSHEYSGPTSTSESAQYYSTSTSSSSGLQITQTNVTK